MSKDFLCFSSVVDQVLSISDMIWKMEECRVSKKIKLKIWQ